MKKLKKLSEWSNSENKKFPYWREVECAGCKTTWREKSSNGEQWIAAEKECSCPEAAAKLLPPSAEQEARLILDLARDEDISPPAKEAVRRFQKIFHEKGRRRNAKK